MIYRKAVTERIIYSALILSVLGCCAVQTAHYTKISSDNAALESILGGENEIVTTPVPRSSITDRVRCKLSE